MKIILILFLCAASVCHAQHYVAFKRAQFDNDSTNVHLPAAAGTVIGVGGDPLPHHQRLLRMMTTDHQIITNGYGEKFRVMEGGVYGDGEVRLSSVELKQEDPVNGPALIPLGGGPVTMGHWSGELHYHALLESSVSLTDCYAVFQWYLHGQPDFAVVQPIGDVEAHRPTDLFILATFEKPQDTGTYTVYIFSGYKEIKSAVSATDW